jgi:hypothetical protein
MGDDTDDVIQQLRAIADALENDHASCADYQFSDRHTPGEPRETTVEIEIWGLDVDLLDNSQEDDDD